MARAWSVSLAALLAAVSVLHGRELCFCDKEFDEACQTEHCLACVACEGHSSAVASDEAVPFALTQADCDHLVIDGVDLLSPVDEAGSLCSVDFQVWQAPPVLVFAVSAVDGFLPPPTAPPCGGDDYRAYSIHALLRT